MNTVLLPPIQYHFKRILTPRALNSNQNAIELSEKGINILKGFKKPVLIQWENLNSISIEKRYLRYFINLQLIDPSNTYQNLNFWNRIQLKLGNWGPGELRISLFRVVCQRFELFQTILRYRHFYFKCQVDSQTNFYEKEFNDKKIKVEELY